MKQINAYLSSLILKYFDFVWIKSLWYHIKYAWI